jgi:acetyl esterase/lipase
MKTHRCWPLVIAAFVLLQAASAAAQLNKKIVIERDVEYGRAGDRVLTLDIVRPSQPAEQPLPVVCFIHGGGWSGGDKRGGVPALVPLAESGNYFGVSVGYRLTGEAIWPAQIHDCKAAIRWLRANAKKYNLNPDKIGVWGMSAGGHLVCMLGTSGGAKELEGDCGSPGHSSRVTCVLNWFGPTDMAALVKERGTPPGVVDVVEKLCGGPLDKKEVVFKAASPITYVSKDDAPVMTMHGTKDPLVPLAQAKLLDEALTKAGVDSTLVIVEGAGHGFAGPEITQRFHAFFDKYLRDRPVEVSGNAIKLGHPEKKK